MIDSEGSGATDSSTQIRQQWSTLRQSWSKRTGLSRAREKQYNLGTAVKDKPQLFMHGISVGVLLPTELPSHHSTECNSD